MLDIDELKKEAKHAAGLCKNARKSASWRQKAAAQAAGADLLVASDDTLFDHPSFRYAGWSQCSGAGGNDDFVAVQKTFLELQANIGASTWEVCTPTWSRACCR